MIRRHNKNAVIILENRRGIQNRLVQEAGQRGRLGQLLGSHDCMLIQRRVLRLIQIKKIPGDLARKLLRRRNFPLLDHLRLLLLGHRSGKENVHRRPLGRCVLAGSDTLLLRGWSRRHIVGIDLDVVDEVVRKVYGSRQIRGSAHLPIHQESNVMGAWNDIDGGRKDARATLAGELLVVRTLQTQTKGTRATGLTQGAGVTCDSTGR